jgi:hypothetical protein
MNRSTDKGMKLHYRMDRFVQQNGEWFYSTREGEDRGPFRSKEEAQEDLQSYIRKFNNTLEFGD